MTLEKLCYIQWMIYSLKCFCNSQISKTMSVSFDFWYLFDGIHEPIFDQKKLLFTYKNYYTTHDVVLDDKDNKNNITKKVDIWWKLIEHEKWEEVIYEKIHQKVVFPPFKFIDSSEALVRVILIKEILKKIKELIPNATVYEINYDQSEEYIWCDGFQFIFLSDEKNYTLRYSLDD